MKIFGIVPSQPSHGSKSPLPRQIKSKHSLHSCVKCNCRGGTCRAARSMHGSEQVDNWLSNPATDNKCKLFNKCTKSENIIDKFA